MRSTRASAARRPERVGGSLAALGRDHQVIVVTHLPQVGSPRRPAPGAREDRGRRDDPGGAAHRVRGRTAWSSCRGCSRGSPPVRFGPAARRGNCWKLRRPAVALAMLPAPVRGGARVPAGLGWDPDDKACLRHRWCVVSGLGKGLTGASLGRLLKARGLRVTMLKLDPYLNVDPGTMNPFEHGEVFVTDDGGETDLDLGHYERFIDESLTRESNGTTGSIYSEVIASERRWRLPRTHGPGHPSRDRRDQAAHRSAHQRGRRRGDHRTRRHGRATSRSSRSSRPSGSFRLDVGRENVCFVHVTLVPFIGPTGEQKTKPTQHSVTELRSRGVQPDAIVCRCETPLTRELERKISNLCDVSPEARDHLRRRGQPVRDTADPARRGTRRRGVPPAGPGPPRGEPGGVGGSGGADPAGLGAGAHRPDRQVREPPGTRTCRSSRLSTTPPSTTAPTSRSRWVQAEEVEGLLVAGRLRDPRRHRHPGRLRRTGHRGQDRGCGLCPREPDPLPRPVLGHAGDDHRVRPQRPRAGRRQLHRVRRVDAPSRSST